MGLATVPDEMVDVDLNLEPECESPGHGHSSNPWGPCHGPVEYRTVCPCGDGGLRCAERIQIIGMAGWFRCLAGVAHEADELRVWPV